MKVLPGLIIASAKGWSSSSQWGPDAEYDGDYVGMECGGLITGSQKIVSPTLEMYIGNANGDTAPFYYSSVHCTWNIELDPSVTSFDLVAKSFAVEESPNCIKDYLLVSDANGHDTYYCGLVNPASLRRRRSIDDAAATRVRRDVTTVETGLRTVTVQGNTATIVFETDDSIVYKGFEICVVYDGDYSCLEGGNASTTSSSSTTSAPSTVLSPSDAWSQIVDASDEISFAVRDFYAALPGLGANSKLAPN